MIDLSVVIASYENAALLQRCLAALGRACAAHPALAVEIIVVDNGSRDASVEVARGSGLPVRIVALARNRGFAAAVNLGLRIRRGRHVLLLNSDAEIEPDGLAGGVTLLDAQPAIGVMGAALFHADGRPQRSVHAFPGLATELWPEAWVRAARGLRRRSWLGMESGGGIGARATAGVREVEAVRGAVFFVRGELFDRLGELDEGYFFFLEETDFCWRVRAAGHAVVFASGLRARHRLGATSKARAPLATRIEYERALDRFLAIRRGPRTARRVRRVRALRGFFGLLLLLLAAPFSARLRRRGRERAGLLLWHLRGRPGHPVLALELAREAERAGDRADETAPQGARRGEAGLE
ncbi:MAG: glycosyltransferase family 2 protein [Myxococcota bacterium]